MVRSQLICVRVPSDVVAELDKLSRSYNYLNRSRIIVSILEAVVKCCPGDDVWKIINTLDPYGDGLKVSVSEKSKV